MHTCAFVSCIRMQLPFFNIDWLGYTDGIDYTLQLTATNLLGSGFASTVINLPAGPFGGNCSVYPTIGYYPHTHSHTHTHSLTHSLTHSPIHSLTHSLTHPLTHTHTHTHTHSHSPTHTLTAHSIFFFLFFFF